MKKRFLFTIVAIALLLSTMAFSVLAAEVTPAVALDDVTTTANSITIKNIYVGEEVVIKNSDGDDVVNKTIAAADLTDTTSVSYGTVTTSNTKERTRGIGTYTVTGLSPDTYSIYVTLPTKNQAGQTPNKIEYTQSAATQVVCAELEDNGNSWPVPDYLYFDSARTLAGLKVGEVYEYAKVTINATKDATIYEVGAYADYAAGTALEAGIWRFRVKAGDNGTEILAASEPVELLSRGDNIATLAFEVDATGNDLIPGKWTIITEDGTDSIRASVNEPNQGLFFSVAIDQKANYLAAYVSYLMKDDEILPLDGFRGWPNGQGGYFRHSTASDVLVTSPEEITGKVIIYVHGGDQATYEVPVVWKKGVDSIMNADFKDVIPENAKGYIYRIDFDIVDEEVHDISTFEISTTSFTEARIKFQSYYSLTTKRISFNAKKAVDAPVLAAQGTDQAGNIEIYGFAGNLEYEYSEDNGITWKSIGPKGTLSVILPVGKSYLFHSVGNSNYYQSPDTKLTFTGIADPLTGLTMSDSGLVTGFKNIGAGSQLKFEWCEVPLGTTPVWKTEIGSGQSAKTLDNTVEEFQLPATGFYAFRIMSNSDLVAAGKPQYFFYYDAETPNTTRGTIATTNGSYKATDPGAFSKGGWITSLGSCYNIQDNAYLIYGPYVANNDTITDLSWKYALTPNEVFPLSDFAHISFQLRLGHNGTIFNTTAYNGRLVIYVVDNNELVTYEIPTTFIHRLTTTVEVTSLWEDEVAADPNFTPSGYVVGLEVFYMNDTEGIQPELNSAGEPKSDSLSFKVVQVGYSDNTNSARAEIGYKADAEIETLTTRDAIGEAKGSILGIKPECEYEIYHANSDGTLGDLYFRVGQGNYSVPIPAGDYKIRSFVSADYCPSDYSQICGTSDFLDITIGSLDPSAEVANVPKIILPSDVVYSETAEYEFDITTARWVNRITLINIAETQPDATLIFKTNKYSYTINASDIDISENNAHYFDMKITFNGESQYDRAYPKMAAKANKNELVAGIHFESTTGFFFENGTFSVYVGEKYNGFEIELTSFNERVERLKREETAVVKDGWVEFTTIGGDFLLLSPSYAETIASEAE